MRNKILIVDDVSLNRDILADIIEEEYKVLEASNGKEALDIIADNISEIAALLLDIQMPIMDGVECLEVLTQNKLLNDFPIIIITGDKDLKTEEKCLQQGVYDFIRKPFNPWVVKRRINNAVSLFAYKNNLEEQVRKQTAKISVQSEILRNQNKKLKELNTKTIELLSEVCEARSSECGTHIKRVKGYTNLLLCEISKNYPEYNLTLSLIERITNAAAMHDIGKIAIPDSILLKPGRLTPEEFEIMKTHTTEGVKLLDTWKDNWDTEYYQLCLDICKYHHEKWDGKGYPCGLKGDEIPIWAQAVSLADCFDALTTDRVYKKAFDSNKAYEMIMNGDCGQFNPKVLTCFTNVLSTFIKFQEETSK